MMHMPLSRPSDLLSTCLLVLSCAGLLNATTITYDLTKDWRNNSNPNGVWQYDAGSTPLPYQSALGSGSCFSGDSSSVSGGYAAGVNFGGNCIPAFIQTTGNATVINDYLRGDILIHSQDPSNGANEGAATLVWKAPVSGSITYSGAIWFAQSPLQRSNDFILSLGSTTLTSGIVAFNSPTGNGRSNPSTFSSSGPLGVAAGDDLTFVLVRSAGQPFGSLDGLQLAVSETASNAVSPEPSPFSLLGCGSLMSLALWWFRSARKPISSIRQR